MTPFGEWCEQFNDRERSSLSRSEHTIARMAWDAVTDAVVKMINQDTRIDNDVKRELIEKIKGA